VCSSRIMTAAREFGEPNSIALAGRGTVYAERERLDSSLEKLGRREVVPVLARLRVSRAELREAIVALYPPPGRAEGTSRRDYRPPLVLDAHFGRLFVGCRAASKPRHAGREPKSAS